MIKFYFHETPNPRKVALFLEETALPYEIVPVDLLKGEQHNPEYRTINPNGKVPAIVDDGVVVFDSAAILIYLADKTGRFFGAPEDRPAVLSWLMFIASGLSPFSGQASHFRRVHTDSPYATNRYRREVERHYGVLDARLGQAPYIAGDDYTIADMAAWGWVRIANTALMNDAPLDPYPNVKRWFETVDGRPAAARARQVGHDIAFKTEFDAETLKALFPQNSPKDASSIPDRRSGSMKYFLLEGEHLAPFDEFRHLEPAHHAFLQKGYDDGFFLFSGPQIPAHGGFLVARAESREALDALLSKEPFVETGKMRFSHVTEFHPAQFQPLLKDWFAGEGG